MAFSFTVEATCGPARCGRLTTPHGVIETPAFMPVGTLASVKTMPQHLLEELGVSILLANTYHLYLRPGAELIKSLGGLHQFMSWPGPILTDSGGFQVFSLSQLRKVSEEGVTFRSHLDGSSHMFTPETAIATQVALGADIIMAFDECTPYPATLEQTQDSLNLTLRWAQRSKDYFEKHKREVPWYRDQPGESCSAPAPPRGVSSYSETDLPGTETSVLAGAETSVLPGTDTSATQSSTVQLCGPEASATQLRQKPAMVPGGVPALFGIVQGGMHAELRRQSAERTVAINFPGYALGGLSVGEPRSLTREVIEGTLPHLPPEKPRYVMGVGYPEEIAQYAAMGVDLMDCVLPTRAARHGLLFTSEGRINIKNACFAGDQRPLDPACGCLACMRYTRAYLRHLYQTREPLAGLLNTIHNLAYYLDTMSRVRQSIRTGKLAAILPQGSAAGIPPAAIGSAGVDLPVS